MYMYICTYMKGCYPHVQRLLRCALHKMVTLLLFLLSHFSQKVDSDCQIETSHHGYQRNSKEGMFMQS